MSYPAAAVAAKITVNLQCFGASVKQGTTKHSVVLFISVQYPGKHMTNVHSID